MRFKHAIHGSARAAGLLALAGAFACGGGGTAEGELSGPIEIDGSSTVYPITEAVAEEFQREHPGTRVAVGVSGTGGGFKRFCAGETDVSNASREITAAEAEQCRANEVRFTELRVAWDGLSAVTNPSNEFVECLTTEELRRIWEPGSEIDNWSQIRSGFPDKTLKLYGPGTDSGTFDYFTETIMGESGASRPDYTASEDDNVLVNGVVGDPGALGYFGFAYYEENAEKLKLLGVDGGNGCVLPSVETIESQTYAPLSRPLYAYVSDRGLAKPQVEAFVEYYLTTGPELVRSVGYIPLDPEMYAAELEEVRRLAAGSAPSEAPAEDGTGTGDTTALPATEDTTAAP